MKMTSQRKYELKLVHRGNEYRFGYEREFHCVISEWQRSESDKYIYRDIKKVNLPESELSLTESEIFRSLKELADLVREVYPYQKGDLVETLEENLYIGSGEGSRAFSHYLQVNDSQLLCFADNLRRGMA